MRCHYEIRTWPGAQLTCSSPVPDPMHRKTTTMILAVLAALVLCAPASANYRVGLSEQSAATFDEPLWQGLKLKRVRYIVPWDFYKGDGTAEVATFMNSARAHNQEVL